MCHIMFRLHVYELTFLSGRDGRGMTARQDGCQTTDQCSRPRQLTEVRHFSDHFATALRKLNPIFFFFLT